jgi:MYXO-CTERM domain-containing protein
MNLRSTVIGVALAGLVSLAATPAFADAADKAACADLEEGDDCTRGDGSAGTCIPDESDASVLTCDDDASGTGGSGGDDSSSSGGCSTGGGDPVGWLATASLLAGLAVTSRRRA